MRQDFDYDVMKGLKLLDAGPEGSVLYELKITERYSNLNGETLRLST